MAQLVQAKKKYSDFQILETPIQALHLSLDTVLQLIVFVVVLGLVQIRFGIVVELQVCVVASQLIVAIRNHVLGKWHLVLFSSLDALGETL